MQVVRRVGKPDAVEDGIDATGRGAGRAQVAHVGFQDFGVLQFAKRDFELGPRTANHANGNPALVEDGRARGTVKLNKPGSFFDKVYTAEISFDVPVLTRDSTPAKRLIDAPRFANAGKLTIGML